MIEAEEIVVAAAESAGGSIKRIDTNDVHRICSGQVIVTLATAVKELVENSVDAGATRIDIRLVEYGSKCIEVSDNGSGIKDEDFEGLCMKHCTSKISTFEDISSVETFGFRGEALSSLCALSKLEVVTRHKSKTTACRIEFGHDGQISRRTVCSREIGTTVNLKNIFFTLPVRYSQFQKNLKREFQKMLNVLYGYCLITDGVRISCSNTLENGKSSQVFNVPASKSVLDKIVCLFGSKEGKTLMRINQLQGDFLNDEIRTEFGLKEGDECQFTFSGYVSEPQQGRRSNDRQYIFMNCRPWDNVKMARVINETYQKFSKNQHPFVYLDVRTVRSNVDANVNPDKRLIFIKQESILYAYLKASLQLAWASAACPLERSVSGSSSFSIKPEISPTSKTLEMSTSRMDSGGFGSSSFSTKSVISSTFKIPKSVGVSSSDSGGFARQFSSNSNSTPTYLSNRRPQLSATRTLSTQAKARRNIFHESQEEEAAEKMEVDDSPALSNSRIRVIRYDPSNVENVPQVMDDEKPVSFGAVNEDRAVEVYDDEIEQDRDIVTVPMNCTLHGSWKPYPLKLDRGTKVVSCKLNFDDLKSKIRTANMQDDIQKVTDRQFRAGIAVQENEAAEKELRQYLRQEMFSEMKIIGQFNLGFIITKHGRHMFLVDQHATDEKYNFEALESSLDLQTQRLISPIDLHLPASSQVILLDRISVFRKNGFEFEIDETSSNRIRLTQIPFSKRHTFGKNDVEELIYLLQDAPDDAFYRPTKVRDMLASRACRKSVMIGTSLDTKCMKKIVSNMSAMKQPWNCPHGRPTIRHLVDLNMLTAVDWTSFNH